MDAQRLQELASLVVREYDEHRIIKSLQALESAFVASVQSPSTDTATQLNDATAHFYGAAAAMKPLSPPRISMLEQVFAADLYGQGLADRVRSTLQASISPANVVAALSDVRNRMTKLRSDMERVQIGLDALGLTVKPEDASAEVEILLPGRLFGGDLNGLSDETERLNDALMILVEAATGSRPPLAVKSISTGSLQLVLSIDPPSGVLILQLTTYILGSIASLFTIRKTLLDLQKMNAPAEALASTREWYEGMIDKKLEEATAMILAKIEDPGRRNELASQTRKSVDYLAKRMDAGMRVNVDTPPAASTDDERSAERQEIAELQRKVIALTHEVQALGPTESVLALLESKDVAGA